MYTVSGNLLTIAARESVLEKEALERAQIEVLQQEYLKKVPKKLALLRECIREHPIAGLLNISHIPTLFPTRDDALRWIKRESPHSSNRLFISPSGELLTVRIENSNRSGLRNDRYTLEEVVDSCIDLNFVYRYSHLCERFDSVRSAILREVAATKALAV